MLSHYALRLLASRAPGSPAFPASLLHAALSLFADLDLSLPRALLPAQLDHHYRWRAGTAAKLLRALVRSGILATVGGAGAYRLTAVATWTPRTLAEQWRATVTGK